MGKGQMADSSDVQISSPWEKDTLDASLSFSTTPEVAAYPAGFLLDCWKGRGEGVHVDAQMHNPNEAPFLEGCMVKDLHHWDGPASPVAKQQGYLWPMQAFWERSGRPAPPVQTHWAEPCLRR